VGIRSDEHPTGSVAIRAMLLCLALVGLAGCSPAESAVPGSGGADAAALTRPDQWAAISGDFGADEARFEFRYQNSTESLYKVHASTLPDMSWDVFFGFGSGSGSPIIVRNPHSVWATYDCGSRLYWRVEAVYTGGILSAIQGPTTVEC
jgi:hypothetical protein